MSNTTWDRNSRNAHFLSSLENIILSHLQTETLKNSQEVFLLRSTVKERMPHSFHSQSFPTMGQIKDSFSTDQVLVKKIKKSQGSYCYI